MLESPTIWYSDAEEGEKVCAWCLDPVEEPGDIMYTSQMAAPRQCGDGCGVGWCSYICQRQDEAMHGRICGLLSTGRHHLGMDHDAINLLYVLSLNQHTAATQRPRHALGADVPSFPFEFCDPNADPAALFRFVLFLLVFFGFW